MRLRPQIYIYNEYRALLGYMATLSLKSTVEESREGGREEDLGMVYK